MLPDKQTLRDLIATLPQQGRLEWIGVRPQKGAGLISVVQAQAIAEYGLQGDHRMTRRPGGKRQVTLIQAEHMSFIHAVCGPHHDLPALLRRNLLVSGINLLALKDRQFRVGDVIMEYSGQCHPCSRMETLLGPGGYNAMRGHGGINARILQGGVIRVGDSLRVHAG